MFRIQSFLRILSQLTFNLLQCFALSESFVAFIFYKYDGHIVTFSRAGPKIRTLQTRPVSGTSVGFPSRSDLGVMESALSLDPDAWHRSLLELLSITSYIPASASITPVRAACIGLRRDVVSV